jgi:hypothetical protein
MQVTIFTGEEVMLRGKDERPCRRGKQSESRGRAMLPLFRGHKYNAQRVTCYWYYLDLDGPARDSEL